MLELIEATEFGDWLTGEISATAEQRGPVDANPDPQASSRLQALETTRKVLLEFLLTQQAMFEALNEA